MGFVLTYLVAYKLKEVKNLVLGFILTSQVCFYRLWKVSRCPVTKGFLVISNQKKKEKKMYYKKDENKVLSTIKIQYITNLIYYRNDI